MFEATKLEEIVLGVCTVGTGVGGKTEFREGPTFKGKTKEARLIKRKPCQSDMKKTRGGFTSQGSNSVCLIYRYKHY